MLRLLASLSLLSLSFSVVAQTKLEADFGLTPTKSSTINAKALNVDWAGFPIEMSLSLGQERYITFFDAVQKVAVKPEIQQASGLLEYEVYGDNLMLRLNENIATRIKVVMANGIIVPIDLSINTSSNNQHPIALKEPATKKELVTRRVYKLNAQNAAGTSGTAVDAIRYAFQRFYSPERLQEGLRSLESAPLKQPKALKLYRTNRVAIKPLLSWTHGGLFVTACAVKNRMKSPVALDPRLLRGQFRMAAFYQDKLNVRGNDGDETLLVLVSDTPFSDAIGIWGG